MAKQRAPSEMLASALRRNTEVLSQLIASLASFVGMGSRPRIAPVEARAPAMAVKGKRPKFLDPATAHRKTFLWKRWQARADLLEGIGLHSAARGIRSGLQIADALKRLKAYRARKVPVLKPLPVLHGKKALPYRGRRMAALGYRRPPDYYGFPGESPVSRQHAARPPSEAPEALPYRRRPTTLQSLPYRKAADFIIDQQGNVIPTAPGTTPAPTLNPAAQTVSGPGEKEQDLGRGSSEEVAEESRNLLEEIRDLLRIYNDEAGKGKPPVGDAATIEAEKVALEVGKVLVKFLGEKRIDYAKKMGTTPK